MKQVISETVPFGYMRVHDVNQGKFYGVESYNSFMIPFEKGFVTRERFAQGNFRVYSRESLTDGNGWYRFSFPTLVETIENVATYPMMRIFEFDTAKELFAWLAT